MRTNHLWTWMGALALSLAACGGTPPLPFESATQRPLKPGEASSLVRRAEFENSDEISHIVVSNEHVFFSSRWDGLYRVPKYGGPVVAVERNGQALFDGLATNGTDVFMLRVTFGPHDEPTTSIRRRGETEQGASHELDGGDFSSLSSNVVGNIAVDGNDLFVLRAVGPVLADGHQAAAIDRYPISGGAPTRVLEIADIFGTPSWVPAGDGNLALAACDGGCSVSLTTGSGARRELLHSNDWTLNARAADGNGIYLTNAHGITFVPRDGSPARALLTTPDAEYIDRPAVVDAARVYAIRYGAMGTQIISVAKDTGAVSVLAEGDQLAMGIWEIAQDADNLFLLRAGVEIMRLPKVRAPG